MNYYCLDEPVIYYVVYFISALIGGFLGPIVFDYMVKNIKNVRKK